MICACNVLHVNNAKPQTDEVQPDCSREARRYHGSGKRRALRPVLLAVETLVVSAMAHLLRIPRLADHPALACMRNDTTPHLGLF